ncbi:STAS domain-containing protein [Nonomuraea sp. NPDC050783]|uniref:STAS domain-containing protein n=1 Tax=Nonomuraea sp. NPDC050783 TaxID=3154634 RepID=UPI003466CA0D
MFGSATSASHGTAEAAMTLARLETRPMTGGVLVTVAGEIDSTNAAGVHSYIEHDRRPHEPLVLDLSRLTFMDSSGLRVLVHLHEALSRENTSLHLAEVHHVPARLLRITGVWGVIAAHPTVEQAVSAALGTAEGEKSAF